MRYLPFAFAQAREPDQEGHKERDKVAAWIEHMELKEAKKLQDRLQETRKMVWKTKDKISNWQPQQRNQAFKLLNKMDDLLCNVMIHIASQHPDE